MATTAQVSTQRSTAEICKRVFVPLFFAAGFLLRLRLAWLTFLNPDEALHYFLSRQPSLKLAYEASLTTAHPPMMILLLHYWSLVGRSEFFLRLPFVAAGIVFCWVVFLWVREVAGMRAAWFACAMALFAPSLVSLSVEIRQYSFLLLFCVCSLYFLECAIDEVEVKSILFSAGFLYLALLTHYSAVFFAFAAGVYGLLRLVERSKVPLLPVWIAGQAGALAICVLLHITQISKLRRSGLPSEIAATWLRSSVFHRGQDAVAAFGWTKTLRLFRYFFSHGTIGFLAFVLLLVGIAVLLRASKGDPRHQRSLAMLLLSPFVVTLASALAGFYPYGGTRHDVLLIVFAIPGIAIGLDRLSLAMRGGSERILKPVLLAAGLLACNFSPSPSGPHIRPRNQHRELMQEAMNSLRTLPRDSVLFTDEQGSVVLNYYLCGDSMPLPFSPQTAPILLFRCGDYSVLVATHTQAGFDRSQFPEVLEKAWQSVPGETTLHLFQSGWIDDRELEWLEELRSLGGRPQNFGPNILICSIPLPQR